jgi:hypothetical protein
VYQGSFGLLETSRGGSQSGEWGMTASRPADSQRPSLLALVKVNNDSTGVATVL